MLGYYLYRDAGLLAYFVRGGSLVPLGHILVERVR